MLHQWIYGNLNHEIELNSPELQIIFIKGKGECHNIILKRREEDPWWNLSIKIIFSENKLLFRGFLVLNLSEIAMKFYSKTVRFDKKYDSYSLCTKYYTEMLDIEGHKLKDIIWSDLLINFCLKDSISKSFLDTSIKNLLMKNTPHIYLILHLN